MWQLLKPHLDTVIGRFVFPCICLTPEELEMFEDDPIEYSRSHFGGERNKSTSVLLRSSTANLPRPSGRLH